MNFWTKNEDFEQCVIVHCADQYVSKAFPFQMMYLPPITLVEAMRKKKGRGSGKTELPSNLPTGLMANPMGIRLKIVWKSITTWNGMTSPVEAIIPNISYAHQI